MWSCPGLSVLGTKIMNDARVFDIRTYTAAPGRLADLKRRFENHTLGFFERHGIEVVGFFESVDGCDSLVYIVAFDDAETADRAFANFGADPEWIAAKAATETDGPLATSIETRRYCATQFSPIR